MHERRCRVATELLAVMEHTVSAEELYFHTLLMNTNHCLQIHDAYFRCIESHWHEITMNEI